MSFPNSKEEALALLYTQSQMSVGSTPVSVAESYEKAYEIICKHYSSKSESEEYTFENMPTLVSEIPFQ